MLIFHVEIYKNDQNMVKKFTMLEPPGCQVSLKKNLNLFVLN